MVWPKNAKNRVKMCRSEITGDLYSFSHFSRKPLILEACFLIQFFLSFRDGHFKRLLDYVLGILKISLNLISQLGGDRKTIRKKSVSGPILI